MKKRSCMKIALITIIFLMVFCAAGINPVYATVEVVGDNTGLRVKVSDVLVPTDNLNPGDTKTSTMTISIDPESDTSSLRVWIRAEIIDTVLGKEVNGKRGNLDDRLVLTVTHENGNELHKGPISKFNKNVLVGDIRKGNPVELTFTVELPGDDTGNEYQGAALIVKWIITAQYNPSERPTPTGTPYSPPTGTPTEKVTVIPTPPPADTSKTDLPDDKPNTFEIKDDEISDDGSGTYDKQDKLDNGESEIIIIEEKLPKKLPKTGELPPLLFFGLGAGIVYAGIRLNHKKE